MTTFEAPSTKNEFKAFPSKRFKPEEQIIPSDFSGNRLRAWYLTIKTPEGDYNAVVNPSGYEAILKDPKTQSVIIISYGLLTLATEELIIQRL